VTDVMQADRDLWDHYGAEIFHGAISGPEVVAMIRLQARADALAEAEWAAHSAIFDLAMKKRDNPASEYSHAVTTAIRALGER